MYRPVVFVLAGVNGAGKSSVGGRLFARTNRPWFNPDTYARHLTEIEQGDWTGANRRAGEEGIRRFRTALATHRSYAFETTLGGRTMVRKLMAAAPTHDVVMWFFGLASADSHTARVRARVALGGHDIPELQIRQRYLTAPRNLIALMPHLSHLRVYDNSQTVAVGERVPDPRLVLDMRSSALGYPRANRPEDLERTPAWAIPIVEAALQHFERPTRS